MGGGNGNRCWIEAAGTLTAYVTALPCDTGKVFLGPGVDVTQTSKTVRVSLQEGGIWGFCSPPV